MEKNQKEEKTLVEKILEKKQIIAGIVGCLPVAYSIIQFLYNLLYQIECEEFYGIPRKYFHSGVENRLVYLGCVILIIIFCVVPSIIKKRNEKATTSVRAMKAYAIFLAIILGIEIGLINVYNLIVIMRQAYKTNTFFRNINQFLNENANITVVVVVFLGSIALLGITLIDEVTLIKWKIVKWIVNVIFSISFVASCLLMIYGTVFKLNTTIEDKTKYEFVTIMDQSYVVLSECEGKILIVPYKIGENGRCSFETTTYSFFDEYEGTYEYIDLGDSPIIENQ